MPRLAFSALALLFVLACAAPAGATYPGDNGRLAVSFAPGDDGSALHTMNPDGSGRVRLTGPGRSVFDPFWSADGTRIVFQDGGDLFVVDADGTDETRLSSDGKSLHPALSPDGRRVAFVHDEYPAYVVYTMNLDGSDRRAVGGGSPFDAPDYSPDGRSLVFSREGRASAPDSNGFIAQTFRIVVADLDRGTERTLTPESVRAHGPSFSPDGRRVVYSTGDAIHVVNAAGGGDVELPQTGGEYWDSAPVFSPDGTQIAFGSGSGVRIVDADGSTPRYVELGSSSPTPNVAWQRLEPVAPPPVRPCSERQAGTARANRLTGTDAGDLLRGFGGDDRLSGGAGPDCLFGGVGDDSLSGGSGDDRLEGFRGDDVLKGGSGRDRFEGGTGRDRLNARDGLREVVDCGPSRDTAVVDSRDRVLDCERVIR